MIYSLYFEGSCTDDPCTERQIIDVTKDNPPLDEVTVSESLGIVAASEEECCVSNAKVADKNYNSTTIQAMDECCTNQSKELTSLIELTISQSQKIDFELKFSVVDSFISITTEYNQDYHTLISQINNKAKDIGKNIIRIFFHQIHKPNSDSEDSQF